MYLVRKNEEIGPQIKRIEIEAPLIAAKAKPGQFVIIRVDEGGERIPLTVAIADEAQGTITVVAQVVGKSTGKLAAVPAGEYLSDVAGPLGTPADIRYVGTVVCVAGGVGNAIIYPEAKAFKEAGNRVIASWGPAANPTISSPKNWKGLAIGCFMPPMTAASDTRVL